MPPDPDDPRWAHLLIEAAIAAGHDRPEVLHDRADGTALLAADRLLPRRESISADSTSNRRGRLPTADGDTTYLCAVDDDRMAVSLIQSNAAGFGSWLVEPGYRHQPPQPGPGLQPRGGPPGRVRPRPPPAPHPLPGSS